MALCGIISIQKIQARLEELADKCTEGQLSADERTEYETYGHALEFIAVLQAQMALGEDGRYQFNLKRGASPGKRFGEEFGEEFGENVIFSQN
jgi:hypothetical protein